MSAEDDMKDTVEDGGYPFPYSGLDEIRQQCDVNINNEAFPLAVGDRISMTGKSVPTELWEKAFKVRGIFPDRIEIEPDFDVEAYLKRFDVEKGGND